MSLSYFSYQTYLQLHNSPPQFSNYNTYLRKIITTERNLFRDALIRLISYSISNSFSSSLNFGTFSIPVFENDNLEDIFERLLAKLYSTPTCRII